MSTCIICKKPDEMLVKVTNKGLAGLFDYSLKREETAITEELQHCINHNLPVFVHEECRKWFNNKRRINNQPQTVKKSRRSVDQFNWKLNCLYCGLECMTDRKNPKRKDWHLASTFDTRESILKKCEARIEEENDPLALQIKTRIMDCIDLIAAEARYHKACSLKLHTKKTLDSSNTQKGRRPNETLQNAFAKTCEWLEMETDLITVQEFRDKMLEFSDTDDVNECSYLKKLLKDRYGAYIVFSDGTRGSSNIICFQDMANFIINKKFKEKKNDVEGESERIIKTAADLIKAEIREMVHDEEHYPTCEDVNRDWIPKSLFKFVQIVKNTTRKHWPMYCECNIEKSDTSNFIGP